MRPATWGDIDEEGDDEMAHALSNSLRCAICGVLMLWITQDGSRPVVCGLDCAITLAKREEERCSS